MTEPRRHRLFRLRGLLVAGHRSPPALAVILLAYLALTLPTVSRQGVNWDEQTDLDIATVYASSLHGLAYGSADDAINTRLPMYTVGMLLRLYGEQPLLLARLLSVLISAMTIVGVYVFCRLELDRNRGLVAALLLATSPYFLFYSKLALSEGDVWITFFLTWVLVAAAWYRRRRITGRLAILGLSVGLAISAKISGFALIPAVTLFLLLEGRTRDQSAAGIANLNLADRGFLLITFTTALIWAGMNVLASFPTSSQSPAVVAAAGIHPVVRWAAGVVVALALAYWIVMHREKRLSSFWSIIACVLIAGLAFLLVPPVHVTNTRIFAELRHQFLRDGPAQDTDFFVEKSFFHIAVILIKSSPVIGIGLWAGVAVAVARIRSRPALRFPLLAAGSYFGFLLLLPWAQTMYMMPVLPALTILGADALTDWHKRKPIVVRAVAAIASLILVFDISSSYPDLNLVGHPWVGERYLAGRATLGYRSIVQTGSDGIEQSLNWISEGATPDENIFTVYGEVHITEAVLAGTGLQTTSLIHEDANLHDADWVITSVNWDIEPRSEAAANTATIYAYPRYDRAVLEHEFDKVFAVDRAYGIEVAAVWQRRDR